MVAFSFTVPSVSSRRHLLSKRQAQSRGNFENDQRELQNTPVFKIVDVVTNSLIVSLKLSILVTS